MSTNPQRLMSKSPTRRSMARSMQKKPAEANGKSWYAPDQLSIGYHALQHATPYTRIGGYAQ